MFQLGLFRRIQISIQLRFNSFLQIIPTFLHPNCKRKVVKVSLKGGLGNQLFQICAGLNYALRTKSLISVTSPLAERAFALDFLGIHPKLFYSIDFENDKLKFTNVKKCRFCIFINYFEDHFAFEEIPNRHSHLKIDGYFQNKEYFQDNLHAIRKLILDALSRISIESVSRDSLYIQIRLGDIATNSVYRGVHGLITDEYLSRALEKFPYFKGLPKVVSDDFFSMTKELPRFSKSKFEKVTSQTDLGDFIQLVEAKQMIISNSTFGWWAAFLSTARVVAPKIWYKDIVLQENASKHLLSEEWIYV